MQLAEADQLGDTQRVGEAPFILAGEPNHHVGGQGEVVDDLLRPTSDLEEVLERAGPPHGSPQPDIAGLERDVEMATDLGFRRQGLEERYIDLRRVDRREPDPLEAGDGAELAAQIRQPAPPPPSPPP